MSDTIANPYDQEAAERAVNHVPPHSLQLERAVLGRMLLSTAATDEIIASDLRPGVLSSGAFKNPTSHRVADFEDPARVADAIVLADLLLRMLDANAESLDQIDGES